MSRKRHNTSSAEPESPSQPNHERSMYDESSEDGNEHEQPQIDVNFGQTGAFPGLARHGVDALFYGPAQDGIDYLRMVRNEASTIPYVLTTTTKSQIPVDNEPEDELYDGFFDEDEAFVAKPLSEDRPQVACGRAQQAYYDSILLRFCALRARLKLVPALQSIQLLPESVPISFPQSSRTAQATWFQYIVRNPPHPVQVAVMDVESIVELLRMVTKKMNNFFRAGEMATRYLGAWLWAVLARFPERGELGSEEIAELRACARTALSASTRLCDIGNEMMSHVGQDSDAEEEIVEDETAPGEHDEVQHIMIEDSVRAHLSHDAKEVGKSSMERMSKVQPIVDFVTTVVGEVYGQRDILELRKSWD